MALAREVREELGCDVVIDEEVGKIITYIDRWSNRQTDYCFTTRFVPVNADRELTTFEAEAGYELVWVADIGEAIELVRRTKPIARDGLLIRERDATFLEAAKATKAVI
jgi:8-oxo-dGTP pyrophosphatase MutT (NUDIX family)